jgi:hypothetical protein
MITPTDLDLPAHLAAEGWQLHQPQPSWPDLRTPDQRLAAELDDLRRRVAAVTQRPTDRQRDPAAQARKGHTTIHNHFRVEQADNPERLALGVMHILTRELRNPTQSARPGLTTLRP